MGQTLNGQAPFPPAGGEAAEPESPPRALVRAALPRKLGLISAAAVMVGSTIGTGIFRNPAGMAAKVPLEGPYVALWVLGGAFTLCGALSYAELSAAIPDTGGVFVYLREGFGRLPAFLFGWTELLVIRASALGAIATVFAEYFLRLIHRPVSQVVHLAAGDVVQSAPSVHYIAAAAVVGVAVLNIAGIQLGAAVQNMTAAAKLLALVLLGAGAFFIVRGVQPTPSLPVSADSSIHVGKFGLALISVLWVYDGWADLTFLAGEVKRPGRNLPLALIGGACTVTAAYLLANAAYIHLMGMPGIIGAPLVAADAAGKVVGPIGVGIIVATVMVSAFGTLNGSMMTGPRIFFAMADEGLFPRRIALVHPRFKTPYIAISLAAFLAVVFVMIRSFDQLADAFVLGIWPFYAGAVAAVYRLRRTRPDMPRPYRTLGYPLTPALFLLAAVFLLGNAVVGDCLSVLGFLSTGKAAQGTGQVLLVFGIIAMGLPVYLLWQKARPRAPASTNPASSGN